MKILTKIKDLKKAISEKAPQFEQSYVLGERLGDGGFAVVHSCEKAGRGNSCENASVAVKVFDRKAKGGLRHVFRTEKKLMQQLGENEHCVQLLDAFEGPRYCHIVMELCGCTVLQALVNTAREGLLVEEQDLTHVFKGMLSGVLHLHKCRIVHRDIKPANLLLTHGHVLSSSTSVKVCDLGLAADMRSSPAGIKGNSGTVPYMAPEILFTNEAYNYEVDNWSCGVTAYLMLLGEFPYQYSDGSRNDPSHRLVEFFDPLRKPLDYRAQPSITNCMKYRVTRWPRYEACKGFTQPSTAAIKFLKSLLVREPLKRANPRSALCSEYMKSSMKPILESQPCFEATLAFADEATKSEFAPVTRMSMEGGDSSANESTQCGSSDDEAIPVAFRQRKKITLYSL